MAYVAKQFSKPYILNPASEGGASRNVFKYEGGADSLATVIAAGYFNSARGLLQVNDRIDVICNNEKVKVTLDVLTVPATGNVTVKVVGPISLQHLTVAAADTIVTGLASVSAVVASLDSDPVDGAMHVSATIGDQAGAPAAGSIIVKTWKSTDGDATLIAATTFGLKVNLVIFP